MSRAIKVKDGGEVWKIWLREGYAPFFTSQRALETAKRQDAQRHLEGIDFMGRKGAASQRKPNERMYESIKKESLLSWLTRNGMVAQQKREGAR